MNFEIVFDIVAIFRLAQYIQCSYYHQAVEYEVSQSSFISTSNLQLTTYIWFEGIWPTETHRTHLVRIAASTQQDV